MKMSHRVAVLNPIMRDHVDHQNSAPRPQQPNTCFNCIAWLFNMM
jgi:hypothetical protein